VIGALLHRPDTVPIAATKVTLRRSMTIIVVGGIIWAAPVVIAALAGDVFLTEIGVFFSKLAVVTFGGAYAVLAYITQEVVIGYEWLTTAQMMDALGLAETTPGPLILVTQFVGMTAGLAEGGVQKAVLSGIMTLWVTFVPCFIWIFAGAPLIDWLDGRPRLRGALSGITAAVVGVIANLSLWFALHVFFGEVHPVVWGPIQSLWPNLVTAQPIAIALATVSGALLLWRHWSLPLVLMTSAALSLIIATAFGAI